MPQSLLLSEQRTRDCVQGPPGTDLLAPGGFQRLEPLHVAAVEGVEGVDQPLPVSAPQRLQHGVHEL